MSKKIFTPKIKEKRWNIEKELELIETWLKEGVGKFDEKQIGSKPIMIIDTPPPYPSGKWHVGGAAHYVQHDIIARFYRMIGYNVLLPFYADRNGLPVEVKVEKAYNINPHEIASTPEGREKFLNMCKEYLDQVEKELVDVWRRLGCSFEYWRDGTDSPTYRRITQATFIDLWNKGYIYEDERPVNWCPRCKTTLSDAEIEYKEEETFLYYIKFRIKETGKEVTVATTRPELLGGCKALIFHPEDERYIELKDKHAIAPIYGHELKIIPNKQADPKFGTGLVMICSYGDQTDIRLFRELGLEPKILIDKNGIMNEQSGPLSGLNVRDAKKKIEELLAKNGLLVKKEKLKHNIPTCWRCGTRLEFINVREYFLKQLDFKEELKKIVEKIKFYPEFHKRKLLDWINSIASDWPISRNRYYATEIPVWKCKKCNSLLVPEKGKYYRPWKDDPPWEKCPKCGAPRENLIGETKVFDTWFDSSISALYVSGYLRNPSLYEKVKDYILRPQGYDIIRTWLYYSVLRIYQLTKRPAFKWVRITGMGLDEKGEAMHKSKGNTIDPDPILKMYGGDAFRYWSAASAKVGYDYKFSTQLLRTGQLFATKLWNIARFISMFPDPGINNVKLLPLDYALLEKLNITVEKYKQAFLAMDTFEPTTLIYNFTWDIFANNYIETVKPRAYNKDGDWSEEEQKAAWATLHEVLRNILKLAAPIMPFVTDAIWRELYSETSIHNSTIDLPRNEWNKGYHSLIDYLVKINSMIWKHKKTHNIKFSEPIKEKVIIIKEAEPLIKHLVKLHKIEKIEIKNSIEEPPIMIIGSS